MYSRKNKSKSDKSAHALLSSNVGDCVVNLGEDYEEAPNIEVINQASTTKDIRSGIPSFIELILGKWITK
jgi:hypothetical protein